MLWSFQLDTSNKVIGMEEDSNQETLKDAQR
jgi:hypothetical protein